MREGRRGLT